MTPIPFAANSGSDRAAWCRSAKDGCKRARYQACLFGKLAKRFKWVSSRADETGLPFLNQAMQRGDRLGFYLAQIAVLHIVRLDQIDIVHAETLQAFVHAPLHALAGEIEFRVSVAADLCCEHVSVAPHATQCFSQHALGPGLSVKRRNVDKANAAIEGEVNRPDCILFRNRVRRRRLRETTRRG